MALNPHAKENIDGLRLTFKAAWSRSLLLNQQMASSLPNLHEEFDRMRKTAVRDASLASIKPVIAPVTLIEDMRERLHQLMGSLVGGGLTEPMRDQLAEAEVGRLIGECPLGWKRSA